MLVRRSFATRSIYFGLISTTVPACTFLIGDSKCGEIFQRWPLSVTTVTVLQLTFITVADRRSPDPTSRENTFAAVWLVCGRRSQEAWRRKPETFDFLGFTHFCNQAKNGKFEVGRVTIGKCMRATLKETRAQLHKRRHEEPVSVVGQWLNRLFRGCCNYYCVPGNTRRLEAFCREIIGAWRHALKRRSQRHRLNWERMARLFIPYPHEITIILIP